MKKTIHFKLNGEKTSMDVAPNDVLLEALRMNLGAKSPKCGCDRGDCGTCTVMINGRAVRSCLILAVEVEGCEVLTLEGVSKGRIAALQRSFVKHNSFQCGFCAPGMIMSLTELLNHTPKPSEDEVKEAIAGNLCRCTGYTQIVEGVMDSTAPKKR